MSHDGTTGFWDPDDVATLRTPLSQPVGYDELKYLSPGRRMTLLYGELASKIDVTFPDPLDGTATVTMAGAAIFRVLAKPDDDFLRQQLRQVRNYADLRLDRLSEINQQISDILSFFGAVGRLDATQKSYTLELLEVVQRLTYDIEMRVKHACWCPRPVDFSPYVMPMIQTPDHSTFPSGHASESFVLATTLAQCLDPGQPVPNLLSNWSIPFRVAHRIAVNRTVAGVHFPVDSAAGAMLGLAIGDGVGALGRATQATSAEDGDTPAMLQLRRADFLALPVLQDGQDEDSGGDDHGEVVTMEAGQDFTSGWLREASGKLAQAGQVEMPAMPVLARYWKSVALEWPKPAPSGPVA